MKVAILLNRDRPRLRTLGKRALSVGYELGRGRGVPGVVLPEFDGFAALGDEPPLLLGTEASVDWRALERCDVLLWEWGWTARAAERVLEIRRRSALPVIVFPGAVDRFWREVEPETLDTHFAALRVTDGVGVMLEDTQALYAGVAPAAHVFHLPVPVDVERFGRLALPASERDPDLVLLSAPTRFCGTASQLPITTFLAFARLVAGRPSLRGLCVCYDDEERRQTHAMLARLGLEDRVEVSDYLRPITRFLDRAKHCRLVLSLPQALIQGRMALTAAALRVPMVTTDEIETHRRLFGRTTVRWQDVDGAVAHAERLLSDDAFAGAVSGEAATALAYYDVPAARARLDDAVATIAGRRAFEVGA